MTSPIEPGQSKSAPSSKPLLRRKGGRPAGSFDRVVKSKPFSMDEYTAVKAYLKGVDPLGACQRYLLQNESPSSTEAALTVLSDLMFEITNQAESRSHGHDETINLATKQATTALQAAAIACSQVVQKSKKERAKRLKDDKEKREAEAKVHGLLPLPLRGSPQRPPHFEDMTKFDRWYDRTYRLDVELDPLELQAKYEEELRDWYATLGFYYKPQYKQHAYSQRIVQSAMATGEAVSNLKIPANIRDAGGRAMDSLAWTVQRKPQASDLVKAWVGGTTLKILLKNDIFTLYSLTDWIKQNRPDWWTPLDGFGPTRAERIRNWLLEVGVQGVALVSDDFETDQYRRLKQIQAAELRLPPMPQLVTLGLTPLQEFIADESINGKHGLFRRREVSQLKAETDIDALIATLNKYKEKTETLKVYAREICRFCLWSYRIKKLPLSSIGVEDAREYREFLQQIPDDWISKSRDAAPRHTSEWKPFRGQLDPISQRKALTSISVIFGQLYVSGYLTGNCFSLVLKHSTIELPKIDTSHALTLEQWNLVNCVLDRRETDAHTKWMNGKKLGVDPRPGVRRLKAILHLLHSTGMRRAELFKARLSDIRRTRVDGHVANLLTVTGKRGKPREVVLHAEVFELIKEHLKDRGDLFSDVRTTKDGLAKIPLISVLRGTVTSHHFAEDATRGADGSKVKRIVHEARKNASDHGALSPTTVRANLVDLFKSCANEDGITDEDKIAFNSATVHWMRHTFGHSMVDSGVDIRVVQSAMGHANINTTGMYSKADTAQLVRGMRHGKAINDQAALAIASDPKDNSTSLAASFTGETEEVGHAQLPLESSTMLTTTSDELNPPSVSPVKLTP